MRYREIVEANPDIIDDFIKKLNKKNDLIAPAVMGNPLSSRLDTKGETPKGNDGLKAGPPYPKEDMENVKAMQTKLERLGYSVGNTGIDGKFGPRTTRAVRAYKKDNKINTDATSLTSSEFAKLLTAKKVKNPSPVFVSSGSGRGKAKGNTSSVVNNLASYDNIDKAKEVVENFLGTSIDEDSLNSLIRATAAEASPKAEERAAVAAVILNRVRHNMYPSSIEGVLNQSGQFQAVTGVYNKKRNTWTGPSKNYTNMSKNTGAQVIGALIKFLPQMDKSWLNFTSNNPKAYGPGTNIDFMYTMRQSPGAEVIGQTVFGTV